MVSMKRKYDSSMPYFNKKAKFVPRAPTRRYKPKTNIEALVKRQVGRLEEKKESNQYSLSTPLPNSANAGWTASSIPICPFTTGFIIPQGTGQGNRIGNRIRTKKAWVKGIIHPNEYNASTNAEPQPYQIRMLIFKDKFNPTGQPAAPSLDLFQSGSTSIGPQNDLVDMILDPNRDRYQIYHDEIMKCGPAANQGSGTSVTFQQFMNNDFSYNCQFSVDVTKFLPTVVTYNDAGTAPMSDSLWMIFLPVLARGSIVPASVAALTMSWTAVYEYTDA